MAQDRGKTAAERLTYEDEIYAECEEGDDRQGYDETVGEREGLLRVPVAPFAARLGRVHWTPLLLQWHKR